MEKAGLSKPYQKRPDRVVAEYQYVREDGRIAFYVCRTNTKRFFIKKPPEYHPSMLRLPYQLDKLVKNTSETVCVCEGEKDADTITSLGYLATTLCNGSSRLPTEPDRGLQIEVAEKIFKDKTVCLFWDYDAPGMFLALSWLAYLYQNYAQLKCKICLCDIPDAKWRYDITDYLDSVSKDDTEKRKQALRAIMVGAWKRRKELIPEAEFWRAAMYIIARTITVTPTSSDILGKILDAICSHREPTQCFATSEGLRAIRQIVAEYNQRQMNSQTEEQHQSEPEEELPPF